jgi:hypothetical protein
MELVLLLVAALVVLVALQFWVGVVEARIQTTHPLLVKTTVAAAAVAVITQQLFLGVQAHPALLSSKNSINRRLK